MIPLHDGLRLDSWEVRAEAGQPIEEWDSNPGRDSGFDEGAGSGVGRGDIF